MIPRRICWRIIPRMSHIRGTKGSNTRSRTLHYFRSLLLYLSILSLLSQCSSTNSRTRSALTSNRNWSTITVRNSSTKYSSTTLIRSISNMSSPCTNPREPTRGYYWNNYHNCPCGRIYRFPGIRVLRSSIYNFRWYVRIYILHGYWIPRYSCNDRYCLYRCRILPNSFIPTNRSPPPRIRSIYPILTYGRRCMAVPIHLSLLMRIIAWSCFC